MDIDIIIYAFVAAVLLLKLWSILGRRDGDDVTRPNPFAISSTVEKDKQDKASPAESDKTQMSPRKLEPFILPPTSLAGGLEQVRSLDSSFDEKKFLQGARCAFTMIIDNFSKDNLAPIEKLLGENVLPHFRGAVEERKKSGQKLDSKIIRITESEVTAARVEQTRAFLTVRFVSEQENTLRDAAGTVVAGEPGKRESVTDIWTFSRDIKSDDPNWILLETHG